MLASSVGSTQSRGRAYSELCSGKIHLAATQETSGKEKRLEVGKPKDPVVVEMRGGEGLNKEMREKIKRLRAELKNVKNT